MVNEIMRQTFVRIAVLQLELKMMVEMVFA